MIQGLNSKITNRVEIHYTFEEPLYFAKVNNPTNGWNNFASQLLDFLDLDRGIDSSKAAKGGRLYVLTPRKD